MRRSAGTPASVPKTVVTLPKMSWFLLTHPGADLKVLPHDPEEASLERVGMKIGETEYRLGNYERTAGKGANAQSGFLVLWSECKLAMYARRPFVFAGYVLIVSAGLVAAALYQPLDRGRAVLGALVLIAMLPASFVPAFFDGGDTGRHLFLFNCVLDLCACAAFWLWLRSLILRHRA